MFVSQQIYINGPLLYLKHREGEKEKEKERDKEMIVPLQDLRWEIKGTIYIG